MRRLGEGFERRLLGGVAGEQEGDGNKDEGDRGDGHLGCVLVAWGERTNMTWGKV